MAILAPTRLRQVEIDLWIEDDEPVIDPEMVPRGYELIDGTLVEKPKMGFESGFTATRLIRLLGNFLDDKPLGVLASSDATFACVPERPSQVRKPDVAVILCNPETFVPPRSNFTKAPELLVEVVSPTDTVYKLDQKIKEFMSAGTKLAWIVNPESRSVLIRRADGTTTEIVEPGELSGENILPGFTLPLSKLFTRVVKETV